MGEFVDLIVTTTDPLVAVLIVALFGYVRFVHQDIHDDLAVLRSRVGRVEGTVMTDGGRRPAGPVARVVWWLKQRSAPTEDASEFDGVLSYAGEWHALGAGAGAGASAAVLGHPEWAALAVAVALGFKSADAIGGRLAGHELKREPWYGIGGVAFGYAVGTAVGSAAVLPW